MQIATNIHPGFILSGLERMIYASQSSGQLSAMLETVSPAKREHLILLVIRQVLLSRIRKDVLLCLRDSAAVDVVQTMQKVRSTESV